MPHSDASNRISALLSACAQRQLTDDMVNGLQSVKRGYAAFRAEMESDNPPSVYGVNRLPGHRETLDIPDDYKDRYQVDLIENHCLPYREAFAPEIAVCIHYAKCCAVMQGQSIISPELYQHLLDLASDDSFSPAIPRASSYSSGDVIPAAHWARSVIRARGGYSPNPGEGMALINGAFVHTGATLAAMRPLDAVWRRMLINMRAYFSKVSSGDALSLSVHGAHAASALSFVTAETGLKAAENAQPPVSIRTIPQVLEAFTAAIETLMETLHRSLQTPTGNPQIRLDAQGAARIQPSGSFANPALSLVCGQLIDALLMMAWNTVRRMTFFLSGEVPGIPQDGATESDPIGLIQWPKLATAKLENMRMRYASRVFTSGSSTSNGVEDFWTHGLATTEQLLACLADITELLELEYFVLTSAGGKTRPDFSDSQAALTGEAGVLPAEYCPLA